MKTSFVISAVNKKSQASIAGMIIIFLVSFLVFCICAIDVGYAVTARYKAQKTTETIALYMASYLNSLQDGEKNTESLNTVKENFENLYSDYKISGNYKFEITEIDVKTDAQYPVKIKITTETSIPAMFLRYAGIGVIKIFQTSYAAAYSAPLKEINSDENSYTYKSDEILTDKKGDDILIVYNKDYLVFAGLKINGGTENEEIYWTDMGIYGNDENKKRYTIENSSSSYDARCISKEETKYDFSADPNKTIGLIQYIKIIKTESCSSGIIPENPDETTGTDDAAEIKPVVTALNSVKIINRKTFLE